MLYNSTLNKEFKVTAAEAIVSGIAEDGGLYVPEYITKISLQELKELVDFDYLSRARCIFSDYLSDFTMEEINECVVNAYNEKKFGSTNPAPIKSVVYNEKEINVLELWHGPTSAFKDMALQILPHLLTKSLKKSRDGKEAVILVATSGDTGKAALEGFKDVENTSIIVFYPEDGVSPMQKRQMATQEGKNVEVCAINGNFDDAQTGVKKAFASFNASKADFGNKFLSSANSINWGRLLPQIVYYFSAYCDMVKLGKISCGDLVNVVVPTGNFGNILAAFYAYKMGLPIKKFICASNSNNVLTDFINTGKYNKNRKFYTTISPSMDILISSNIERFLYLISENDTDFVSDCMTKLKTSGTYSLPSELHNIVKELFYGGYSDEKETKSTIKNMFLQSGYLIDTHTAVAVDVYDKYVTETGDNTPVILASTANPYKFSKSVLESLTEKSNDNVDEFELVDMLYKTTKAEVPQNLLNLKDKEIRFKEIIEPKEMYSFVTKKIRHQNKE